MIKRGRILISLIILVILILNCFFTTVQPSKNKKISGSILENIGIIRPLYKPYNITPADAAYHKTNKATVEWWYFEGILDNSLSFIFGMFALSKNKRGICTIGFQLYNNSAKDLRIAKNLFFKDIEVSEEYPSIKINGEKYIEFDIDHYNKTGEWIYNITILLEGNTINLTYKGLTKGYKGEILGGWYGPVLPKAEITGTLILNGEIINVNGVGYHEHGWNIRPPIWESGWYWGKIYSKNYSVLWVKMMQTPIREQQRFVVFSPNKTDYIYIPAEKIKFEAYYPSSFNLFAVPKIFKLNISDSDNNLYIDVLMESENVHLTQKKINRYYRYHVKINGFITYNGQTEQIENKIQIMELTRFPSLIPIL